MGTCGIERGWVRLYDDAAAGREGSDVSNPRRAVIPGYVTELEASGAWALMENNDRYAVVGVNIGFGALRPAEKNVCWVIVPADNLP